MIQTILVRAVAGRVAKLVSGKTIPHDKFVPVIVDRHVDRLLNVWKDIEQSPADFFAAVASHVSPKLPVVESPPAPAKGKGKSKPVELPPPPVATED